MVPVRCRTNLDFCQQMKWPQELPSVPSVGHLVRANENFKGGYVVELEVARVTWIWAGPDSFPHKNTWYAEVELGMVVSRGKTIPEFENWINKISGRISQECYERRAEQLYQEKKKDLEH